MMVAGMLIRGLVELYFTYETSRNTISAIQQEQARAAVIRIESFLGEIVRPLAALPIRPSDPSSLTDRREDHVRLLRQMPAATDLAYLAGSGFEQIRVSRVSAALGRDPGDDSWDVILAGVSAGRPSFGQTYFRGGSEPYTTVAYRSPGDDGATVAEVNLKLVWDIVAGIRVGEQGYAYVVDTQGALIAHPDLSLVLRKTDASQLTQVQHAIAGPVPRRGMTDAVIGEDFKGQRVLSSFAPVSGPGWFVVVERPLNEAFGPLYASLLRTALMVVGGIAISLVVSWRTNRRPSGIDLGRTE